MAKRCIIHTVVGNALCREGGAMTMDECVGLVEWANRKFPGWYQWATARRWTWDKLRRLRDKHSAQPTTSQGTPPEQSAASVG
jgi:hypothetical protein